MVIRKMKMIYIVIICMFTIIGLWYKKMLPSMPTNTLQTATIGLAGDTMLGRLVNETLRQNPSNFIWGDTLPLLHATDINLVNLECVFTTSNHPVPKVFNFKSDPEHVQALMDANITVVNLANNHSLDFGAQGLFDTLTTLDRARIHHVGAGKNIHEAQKPIIIEKNGIRFGFLGYTDNEPTWLANEHKPGTNYISIDAIQHIASDIKAVRSAVDILVLSIHWGPNMKLRPSTEFQEAAHQLIEWGVDIIHGHSAHLLQGIEVYKNRLILYDTGDFIDDYAVDSELRNDWSALYHVIIEKKNSRVAIKQLQIVPLLISHMRVNRATETEKSAIIQRLQNLSQERGTSISQQGIINIR